jgi:hypothetical protein
VLIVSTIHDEHIGMSTIVSERAGTRPDQVVQVARLWVVLEPEKELLLRQSSEQRLNGCVCVCVASALILVLYRALVMTLGSAIEPGSCRA